MTRWPRAAAPAWPVHAGFLVAAVTAGTAYVMAGPQPRSVIFALVTLVPVATFAGALSSGHLTDRRPWAIAMTGLVLLSISFSIWPDWVPGHHLGRAEGRPADFVMAAAHLLFLAGAGGVLRKHGANDFAGLLDAALFAVCVAGPAWAWLIAPRLTPAATPLGSMLALADVVVLAAVLAALCRIGARACAARGPMGYLLLCCAVTLAAHVAAVLTAENGSATWTMVLLMLAFVTIAAAPVHPAAPLVTHPDRPGREVTGRPPLLWMGAALSANPLIAAIQAVRGDESASVLLPVGTVLAVPLVLLRLRQMSLLRGEAERTLAYHAHHDDLTGLYNRRRLSAELDRALADVDTGVLDEVSVVIFDLDGFKPINDRYGHRAGDEVLRVVAGRLAGLAAPGDVLARVGGDEFLLLRRGQGPGDVPSRAAGLMDPPIDIGTARVRVGVSAGAATARRGSGVDRDALVGRADAAMYAEKAAHQREREPVLG